MNQEISMKNTKSEILKAYEESLNEIKELKEQKLDPNKIKQDKKKADIIEKAEASISGDLDIEKFENMIRIQLGEIGNKLTSMKEEYQNLKEAVNIQKSELKEIYDIESEALTLTSLIEAHKKEEISYKAKMSEMKTALENEITQIKEQWEIEKSQHALNIKERNEEDKKKYQRTKEEWEYSFNREKQLAMNKFSDEKAKLEKQLSEMSETAKKNIAQKEQELELRENAVQEKEERISLLEKKVAEFDKTLIDEVEKAKTETTEKLTEQYSAKENLLIKQYEGEINVLNTRIANLEQFIEDQKLRMQSMEKHLEASYRKVEEIAIKALDNTSSNKTMDSIEKILIRQDKQTQNQ